MFGNLITSIILVHVYFNISLTSKHINTRIFPDKKLDKNEKQGDGENFKGIGMVSYSTARLKFFEMSDELELELGDNVYTGRGLLTSLQESKSIVLPSA